MGKRIHHSAFRGFALGVFAVLWLGVGCSSSLPGLTRDQSAWLQGDLPPGQRGGQLADYRFRGEVRQWLYANGTDPNRCRFDWDSGPGWYESEHHGLAVWKRPVQVNAKDRTGRYRGFEPYIFVVRGGRVVDIIGMRQTPLAARR